MKNRHIKIQYRIRWKVLLGGVVIVLAATWLTDMLTPYIINFMMRMTIDNSLLPWVHTVLPTLIFVVFAVILMLVTSQTMINRVLDLSAAAKEIAHGNFNVKVNERKHNDELYELACNFNIMAAELQNQVHLRQDFISSISHEIKTPLAIIKGYADLLGEDQINIEERKNYANIISNESTRLLKLCSNILSFSQLDKQAIIEKHSEFRLDEQLRRVLLFLEPHWSKKQLEIDADLPVIYYYGDQALLEQVWFNLLENAIKYSNQGKISIRSKKEKGKLHISISDQGIGMDEQTAQHVFDRFFQGDVSHHQEGAGLGLPIVERIIELHNGSIELTSTPNKGSTFTVYLPIGENAPTYTRPNKKS